MYFPISSQISLKIPATPAVFLIFNSYSAIVRGVRTVNVAEAVAVYFRQNYRVEMICVTIDFWWIMSNIFYLSHISHQKAVSSFDVKQLCGCEMFRCDMCLTIVEHE